MKLLWDSETRSDDTQHYILKRQTLSSRPFLPLHTHDYAEMVYVERGSCTHVMNDVSNTVGKGDVLFMLPDNDEHQYVDADRALSLLQILFEKDSLAFLIHRYGPSVARILTRGHRSPLVTLTPLQQIWFERSFNALLVNPGSLIAIERFLLNFAALVDQAERRNNSAAVSWIEKAFQEIQEPANFRKGVRGFVDICNRSGEHVEREVKKLTGNTITDVVNQARMAWASYMLIYSDMEIIDLAEACGFGSHSRFYKVFRDHFGLPPARYRKQTRQAPGSQETGSYFSIHTNPPGFES